MDLGTFTFQNLFTLVGMLITGAVALVGVWYRMELRVREVERKASHDARNVDTAAQARAILVDKDLTQYKLYVAEHYPSRSSVQALEDRLEKQLENLAGKVDDMPDLIVNRITNFLHLKGI